MNSLSRPKHSSPYPSTAAAVSDTAPRSRKHPRKTIDKVFNDKTQLLPPFSALSLADKNYTMNNFSTSNNSDEDPDDGPGLDANPGRSAANFSMFNDSSTNSSSSSLSSVLRRSSSSSIQSSASSISSDSSLPSVDGYQCAPRYSALASLHNDSLNRRSYFSKHNNASIPGSGISSMTASNSPSLEQGYVPRPLPRTPKKTQKSYGALGTVYSNTPRKRIIQPTFHYHESAPQRPNSNTSGSPSNNGRISPNFGSNDSSPIIMSKKRISLERDVPRVVYSSNQVYPSNNSDEEDFDWDGSPNMNTNNNNFYSQRWQRRTQSPAPFTPTHRSSGSVGSASSTSPGFDVLMQSPGRRCLPRHTELTPCKSSLKAHPPQNPYALLSPTPPLLLPQRPGSQQGKRPLPSIAAATRSSEKLGFYSKQDLVRRESDGNASSPSTARRVASYQKHARRFSSSSLVSANGGAAGGNRSRGRGHRRNKSATVSQPAPAQPVRKRVAWAAVLEW